MAKRESWGEGVRSREMEALHQKDGKNGYEEEEKKKNEDLISDKSEAAAYMCIHQPAHN